jgi:hypothetical protein
MDPQSRAGGVRTFHPDILRLLDVFARIERRRQERLQSTLPARSISRPSGAILRATGGLRSALQLQAALSPDMAL